MIRHVRGRSASCLEFTLTIWDKHQRRQVSLLTAGQNEAVAKFVRFILDRDSWMLERMRAQFGELTLSSGWQAAFDSHWKRFDTG